MTARELRLFDILTGPLLPDLKVTHASVPTAWVTITGAPGSGKSSLCSALGGVGHMIIPEVSRTAIDEAVQWGFSPEEVFAHGPLLSEAILIRKLAVAQSLSPSDPWIWDTGLGDAVVFCQMAGVDISRYRPALSSLRFKKVILLEPLDRSLLPADAIRPQTEHQRTQLHTRLLAEYQRHGCPFLRIQSGPHLNRVQAVNAALD